MVFRRRSANAGPGQGSEPGAKPPETDAPTGAAGDGVAGPFPPRANPASPIQPLKPTPTAMPTAGAPGGMAGAMPGPSPAAAAPAMPTGPGSPSRPAMPGAGMTGAGMAGPGMTGAGMTGAGMSGAGMPGANRPLPTGVPTASPSMRAGGGANPAPAAPAVDPTPAPATESETGRRLIVGREISLSGAITACDHLVVEGEIEATLDDCQTIRIVEGGTFRGKAHVVRADIGGLVDGELIVSGKLTVRSTGSIEGSVTYATLAVEEGGRIAGTLKPIDTDAATDGPDAGADGTGPEGSV